MTDRNESEGMQELDLPEGSEGPQGASRHPGLVHRPTRPWLGPHRPLVHRVARPVIEFLHIEASDAILLFVAALIALLWANSPWGETYTELWATELSVGIGASASARTSVTG